MHRKNLGAYKRTQTAALDAYLGGAAVDQGAAVDEGRHLVNCDCRCLPRRCRSRGGAAVDL